MRGIDPIGAGSPFPPITGGLPGRERRGTTVPNPIARRAVTVTIDLNSDTADRNVVTIERPSNERPRDDRDRIPEESLLELDLDRMAELPREHLVYEVVARLGRVPGFGEKGRVLNRFL